MPASYFKMHPSHFLMNQDLSIANVLCTTSDKSGMEGMQCFEVGFFKALGVPSIQR